MAVEAPERIKSNLDDARNRAARPSPSNQQADRPGNLSPSLEGGLGTPLPSFPAASSQNPQTQPQDAQQEGAQRMRATLEGVRNQARAKQNGETKEEQKKTKTSQAASIDLKDFFRRSIGFALLGLAYDLLMAALDFLLGLGSIVSIPGNFVMWGIYWFRVWRFMPKSLRGNGMLEFSKARKHFALNMIIETIPIVGQIWLGWFGIGLDAYIMVSREKKKQDLAQGGANGEKKAGNGKGQPQAAKS